MAEGSGVDPIPVSLRRVQGVDVALCEGVIEAGWLLALAVVPVFFNVFSHRVFEPEKVALLQLLCLVMGVAWLLKVGFGGLAWRPGREWRGSSSCVAPVRWLVMATLIGLGTSALLSVDRGLSWSGSYERAQGVRAELTYLAIFLLTLGHLRTRDQWRRVVRVLILASIPVSLYAIAQHFGADPWPWQAGTARASSTLGNPIFLGGYLVMTLFLTGHELVDRVGDLATGSGGRATQWRSVVHAGCLLYVVATQWMALFWTYSRGPLLAFLAGLFVVFALLAMRLPFRSLWRDGRRRMRRWVWLALAGALLAVSGLALRGAISPSPATPSESGRASRLAGILDPESRTALFRRLMWSAVVDLVAENEDLDPRTGAARPAPAWRPWTGRGPETLALTIGPHLSPALVRLDGERTVFDRAHNETLQRLATGGVLGAGLQLAWTCLFWGSLITAMAPGSAAAGRYWIPPTAAAVAAVIALGVTGTMVWSSLAAAAGLAAGMLAIAWRALGEERGGGSGAAWGRRAALSAAVLATLVAHFVETSFGIAITVTSLYFWFLGAVAILLGRGWLAVEQELSPHDAMPARRASWVDGFLVGSVVVALLFAFGFSRAGVIPTGKSSVGGWGFGQAAGWRLAVLTSIVALILLTASRARPSAAGEDRSIVAAALGAVIPVAAYGTVQWLRLGGPLAAAAGHPTSPHAAVESLSTDVVVFATLLLSLLLLLGVAIGVPRGVPLGRRGAASLAILFLVALAGPPMMLRPLRADVFAAQSFRALEGNQPQAAAALAVWALELAPRQDAYLALHGGAASRVAAGSGGSLEPALASLAQAAALRPLDGGHAANLARVLVQMGDAEDRPTERASAYGRARWEYERALRLQPWSSRSLAGLGGLLLRLGDVESGCEKLRQAARLDESTTAAAALLAQCPAAKTSAAD